VIPSPRFESEKFINCLVEIVKREHIDMVIPMFEEIFYVSKKLEYFPTTCQVFCSSLKLLDTLHNKWLFNEKLHHMGKNAPTSFLIKTKRDLDRLPLSLPYILKPCYSRAAQKVIKVEKAVQLKKIEIDVRNPWVAQEWLRGRKLCTYSIGYEGKLKAHVVYPLQFAIGGSSCLNFEAIEHPKIEQWVKEFVAREHFTGQLGFDFIEVQDKGLYPIECNPRSTSGLHLFRREDDLPSAFLDTHAEMIKPQAGFSKQIAIGMLLYGWRGCDLSNNTYTQFIKKLFSVEDVIFSRRDLMPFFFQPLLFFSYLIRCLKLRMRIPSMFTFDTNWNGECQKGLETTDPR